MTSKPWTSIKLSADTYEKMKELSAGLGLSMDSILRELLSFPDSIVPSETLWMKYPKEFYAYQKGGREELKKAEWSKHHDDKVLKNSEEKKG